MRKWMTAALAALALAWTGCAFAQDSGLPPNINIPTTNNSAIVTTGGTFQLLLPAVTPTTAIPLPRRTFTFQNNNGTNTTDICYLIFGANIASQITAGTSTLASTLTINGNSSITYKQASQRLQNGGSDGRYTAYIPYDAVYGTCDTTGDSIYIDTN